MIDRISSADIRELTALTIADISEHERDEMAIPTYTHYNPLIRWLMWRRYDCLAEMLGPEKSRAFEFGCGIGLFLPELHKRYERVVAMDLFPQYAMALCKSRKLEVDFISEIEALEDASLDVIIAADVLEHIEDLGQYLQMFHEKLSPEGRLLVSGPTENRLYKFGRFIAGFSGKADYHHTNIFKLIDEIAAAGFSKKRVVDLPFPVLPTLFRICEFVKQG